MKHLRRFVLTISIWGGIFYPMLLAISFASTRTDSKAQLFLEIAIVLTLLITVFIWLEERIFASFGYYKQTDDTKRKNTDQNADAALLLLELLSDDERRNIRQRLMRRSDGEIPQVFANEEEYEYNGRY